MDLRPLLIGESHPQESGPEWALYPAPKYCAGWNLCYRIMGLASEEYLNRFDRVNLCDADWDLQEARESVARILSERDAPLILLGAKVCHAFNVAYEPFSVQTSLLGPSRAQYILPHPSGRSRAWNDPDSVQKARELLKEFL